MNYYSYKVVSDRFEDLNSVPVRDDSEAGTTILSGGQDLTAGDVTVMFNDLADQLAALIRQHDVTVGCVAWLTNQTVLDALAERQCQIVLQKEDFLRPDNGLRGNRRWKNKLRKAYEACRFEYERNELPHPVRSLSVSEFPADVEPFRCIGYGNTSDSFLKPIMHHKFLVFCDHETTGYDLPFPPYRLAPRAVWTGSYNPTNRGSKSMENALVIRNDAIVTEYMREWSRSLALSEPLDWETEWVAPEWRLGT